MSKRPGFSKAEIKSIMGLSSVLGLRMLGLSLIIPVFSVYATGLPGSTPFLAGLAFGVYGFTQAILQIPFGYISDRWGRKPVVIFGMTIFGIASIAAALTTNIYVLIVARFCQGAGAIASACFAWISDITHESRRNMAMAFMGISIGGGVVLGMIMGPMVGGIMGARFLFWVAAILSLIAIFVIIFALKEPEKNLKDHDEFPISPFAFVKFAATRDLIKLDIAGFIMNAGMIATFFSVPLKLAERFSMGELWKIYVPLSVFSAIAMMFSSRRADGGSPRAVICLAFAALVVAFCMLFMADRLWPVVTGFAIFFTSFSVLEAAMPAAVSRLADPIHKGSVIGVYNFSQFMGTFAGGVFAGWMNDGGNGEKIMFLVLAGFACVAMVLINSAKGVVAGNGESN